MAPVFPSTSFAGVVTDFSQRLDLDGAVDGGPATYFFPGSSIGNFSPEQARAFLTGVRSRCASGSGLLIGVDTTKDHRRLVAAYDDALGVTAAFNRNILRHVNALARCDFDPASFAHVALYDAARERIEMHLQARSAHRVRIGNAVRKFAAGERIHTESSHKYAPADFTRLLQDADFGEVTRWQDAHGDFAVYYAR